MTEPQSSWTPQQIAQSQRLQDQIAGRVQCRPLDNPPQDIAGVAYAFEDDGRSVTAAAVILSLPDLIELHTSVVRRPAPRPYRSGLLAFSVLPAVHAALDGLHYRPDVALVLGHGIAHPRRCGLASHLGVSRRLPTIGCAARPVVGQYREPAGDSGESAPLKHRKQIIGMAVRTRTGVNPLIISVGHMVTLQGAVELVLACTGQYRWPEPIRRAGSLARLARQ